ncbi:hypothetical protein JRO89_XS08G0190500 [Xanthoceras sorbifolium]|uniref:DUF4283 domain-containing protein n=1 Tax=Xanthoceras sorbifolium TaxID=99658 RepID=A0ABQ8HQF0_9ROSI|nr:hypothetical protein JRO89_XS08G0190500 [Xanthoceras sorbifolium]
MDRKPVLMGGPWSFDNALRVLEIPTGFGDFAKMQFQWMKFWIQIHNVPLICMTKNIGLFLGQSIGMVKDTDVGASGDCFGKFLRVRVSIDTLKPRKECLDEEDKLTIRSNSDFAFGSWMRASSPGKVRSSRDKHNNVDLLVGGRGQQRSLESVVVPTLDAGRGRVVVVQNLDSRSADKGKVSIQGSVEDLMLHNHEIGASDAGCLNATVGPIQNLNCGIED